MIIQETLLLKLEIIILKNNFVNCSPNNKIMVSLKCDSNCWKSAFLVLASFLIGWFLCCAFCVQSCDAYSGATYGKDCKKQYSIEKKMCSKTEATKECSKTKATKKCSKTEATKKCTKKKELESADESESNQ